MSSRWPFWRVAAASLAALGVLAYLIRLEVRPAATAVRPLVVFCAAALKPAMQAIAAEYEREEGTPIEFRFGASEHILAGAALSGDGDLFLPADASYVRSAESRGLVAQAFPLARMKVVVLTRPGNPRSLSRFDDLLKPDLRLGLANPDAAAIGKVTREHLARLSLWKPLAKNTLVYHSTVTDAANAVLAGGNDATIVWDVVAAHYPSLAVVHLPELEGIIGMVEIAILKSSPDRDAAERFVRYIRASDRGEKQFLAEGFTQIDSPGAWTP